MSNKTMACASVNRAFLAPSDFGDFVVLTHGHFTKWPFDTANGRLPSGYPRLVEMELRGYIAMIAVNGADRASEDATARAAGYEIGKFPLVPLSGDVVLHNRGVLEVYESNWTFIST
ncbi:MAG: hypothetical protein ACREP9_10405, partial [Candidatus Dormibacteraceae bacterium]